MLQLQLKWRDAFECYEYILSDDVAPNSGNKSNLLTDTVPSHTILLAN